MPDRYPGQVLAEMCEKMKWLLANPSPTFRPRDDEPDMEEEEGREMEEGGERRERSRSIVVNPIP